MLLTLLAMATTAAVLAVPLMFRRLLVAGRRRRGGSRRGDELRGAGIDPGRERRAEQRARDLLRSCVNAEEWAMYRDLGFIRVNGKHLAGTPSGPVPYAYLIYPHKPIVAYVPSSGRLLSEYCVDFPDLVSGSGSRSRLPASDDVLAKWMALTGDERRLLAMANMHLPGRQVDPGRVRRDLWRLKLWERERRRPEASAA